MAQEVGIHTATNELYRLFHLLNTEYFGDVLPLPMITIQKGGMGVLGWVTVKKVWLNTAKGGEDRYEITIVAENLARSPKQIAATLLHEMVHLSNLVRNIVDSSGHQYHNKHFKAEAERVGLTVTQVPRYGFATTHVEPDSPLDKWLGSTPINPEAFRFYRQGQIDLGPIIGPRGGRGKGKMLKWSCGCTNVRCAVELLAVCAKCGNPFLRV